MLQFLRLSFALFRHVYIIVCGKLHLEHTAFSKFRGKWSFNLKIYNEKHTHTHHGHLKSILFSSLKGEVY